MGTKLNKDSYEKLIDEDLKVLYTLPHSCERMHMEAIIKDSIRTNYPSNKISDNSVMSDIKEYQELTFKTLDACIKGQCIKGNSSLTLSKSYHSMGDQMVEFLVKKGFKVYIGNTLIKIEW